MEVLDMLNGVLNRYLYWMGPTKVTFIDIVEVVIISVLLYRFMAWVKQTRAWSLLKGLIVIMVFIVVAAVFQMNTILWLAERLFSVGVIAVVVVFQPELRNALEHLGRRRFFGGLFDSEDARLRKSAQKVTDEVVSSCMDMGTERTGALICFERDVPLDEYVRTGIGIDASVSRQLIRNIFEKNTPLHDGAVIIRENRIVAATCYLPLSDDMRINKSYGTRHRAALGLSEVSDSLTVIVSEETGKISLAMEGELTVGVDREKLKETVLGFLTGDLEKPGRMEIIIQRLRRRKDA